MREHLLLTFIMHKGRSFYFLQQLVLIYKIIILSFIFSDLGIICFENFAVCYVSSTSFRNNTAFFQPLDLEAQSLF